MDQLQEILFELDSFQLPTTNEAELQKEIESILKKFGVVREYKLGDGSRIDFFCNGIGIECKIKGSARSILRQCERYSTFQDLKALILVTSKSSGFPETLNGLPVYVISLGEAWL